MQHLLLKEICCSQGLGHVVQETFYKFSGAACRGEYTGCSPNTHMGAHWFTERSAQAPKFRETKWTRFPQPFVDLT